MEPMTELDKMKRAHMYLSKLADGIDPLTGRELPEDTLLNHVRLSRCFFYVADVLRQVIENGGEVGSPSRRSLPPFQITAKELLEASPAAEPLPITQLCQRISALKPEQKKLHYGVITQWLEAKGFLSVEMVGDKRRRRVTPQGSQLGIWEELREYPERPPYYAILYGPEAQQFIIDNLPQILAEA